MRKSRYTDSQIKPNLFIIGAMKSGTTSLHSLLDQSAQLSMSTVKEPARFISADETEALKKEFKAIYDDNFWNDHEKYLLLFSSNQDALYYGESSTAYTKYPTLKSPAQEINNFNPDSKIIYIIRNPAKRAISEYWHQVFKGQETLPIEQALTENSRYLQHSDYPLQISQYLSLFPLDQVKIIIFEELITDEESVIDNISQWLGIKSYRPKTEHLNSFSELAPAFFDKSYLKPFKDLLPNTLKSKIKSFLFDSKKEKLRNILGKQEHKILQELTVYYQNLIPEWEKKLGISLSDWNLRG
jgi:hypothetical protein